MMCIWLNKTITILMERAKRKRENSAFDTALSYIVPLCPLPVKLYSTTLTEDWTSRTLLV